jgi:hypothetical protein
MSPKPGRDTIVTDGSRRNMSIIEKAIDVNVHA